MIFDNLPEDLILKCHSYIYYPQSNILLQEIQNKYIKTQLNKFDEKKLKTILYELLKSWYILYANSMIEEYKIEYEGIKLYIESCNEIYDDRIKLWIEEILELINKNKLNKKCIIYDYI
jgi:DNA primase